jgi:hypothetical protein
MQEGEAAPHGCGVAVVDDVTTVYLLLSGILDANKEIEKLGKKQAEAQDRVGGGWGAGAGIRGTWSGLGYGRGCGRMGLGCQVFCAGGPWRAGVWLLRGALLKEGEAGGLGESHRVPRLRRLPWRHPGGAVSCCATKASFWLRPGSSRLVSPRRPAGTLFRSAAVCPLHPALPMHPQSTAL